MFYFDLFSVLQVEVLEASDNNVGTVADGAVFMLCLLLMVCPSGLYL